MSAYHPQPSLKRRSAPQFESPGDKRMRVSVESEVPDDFAAIIARAAATVAQEANQTEKRAEIIRAGNTSAVLDGAPSNRTKCDIVEEDEQPGEIGYDASINMCMLSLPMLESLSVQLLATLASGNYNQAIDTITNFNSESGQAYSALKSLFDQTKRIYSNEMPFLYPDDFDIMGPRRTILHNTNLATFLVSVFGGKDVGFYDLNDNFLNIFAPDGKALTRRQGKIYIDLKTQMLVAAATSENGDTSNHETIETLFPPDLESGLALRHPGVSLSDSEMDFLESAQERRQYLSAMCNNIDSIQTMSEEFTWENFLRSISDYLRKIYKSICAPYIKSHTLPPSKFPRRARWSGTQLGLFGDFALKSIEKSIEDEEDSLTQHAADAVQLVLQSMDMDFSNFQDSSSQTQQAKQEEFPTSPKARDSESANSKPLPGKQSEPTAILYERARLAAANKTVSKPAGKPGPPSLRRPWSSEEEGALMTGLDQVKGPHWSQILALYGQNGTINEVLKDRNQVQLKDKARNLKLFFLKSNIEVPHYLSQVTGELRTRAPSQAAKREIAERRRMEEEVVALGNGLQEQENEQDRERDELRSPTTSSFEESNYDPEVPEQLHVVEPGNQTQKQRRDDAEATENDERLGDEEFRMRLMQVMPSAGTDG